MKNKRWLWVFGGVVVFSLVLILGAAGGAALTYFLFESDSLPSVFAAPADIDREAGILISSVQSGSPAEDAGLVRGDILQEINGAQVDTLADLRGKLADLKAGETVQLTAVHGDEIRTLEAVLGENGDSTFLGISACEGPMVGSMALGGPDYPGGLGMMALSSGAQILEVLPGGPAEKAGLAVGDLILSVDGQDIDPDHPLADLIQANSPGDEVALSVQSNGDEEAHEVAVTLGENPDVTGQAYLGIKYHPGMGSLQGVFPFTPGEDGLPWLDPNGELPKGFDPGNGPQFFFHGTPALPEGVESAAVVGQVVAGSPAEEAGLKAGDIILAVDDETIDSPDALVKAVQSRKPGDKVSLTIYRDGEQIQVSVTLAENPDDPGTTYLGVLAGLLKIQTDQDSNGPLPKEFPNLPGGDA